MYSMPLRPWPSVPTPPEQRAGERAARIRARRLGHEADPGQPEPAHLLRGGVVDRVGEVRELQRTRRQLFPEVLLVGVQDRRELRRCGDRVGNEHGVGVDRRALDRDREVAPVAVEDAAARGTERDRPQALRDREPLVAIRRS